jgi:hypothetical protein
MKSPTCTIMYQTILATIRKSGLYDFIRVAYSQPLTASQEVGFVWCQTSSVVSRHSCPKFPFTSLPGLLGRASFCLKLNLARKTEQVKKKVTKIRSPPFAAEIDPLLSRDDDTLRPDASAHCRLATCHSVWSGGSTVASGGLGFK